MQDQVLGGHHSAHRAERPVWPAVVRGFRCKCPNCGEGRLFKAFVKTVDRCEKCGEDMHHHRADDLPAYLVIAIVGHIVVAAFMGVEMMTNWTSWQHLALWLPITMVLSLALLQPIKGAVVGLQWALRMHGFGSEPEKLDTHPEL
jgi:uncharacterized protein (DUF983 family)